MPRELIESELFGHARGAFSGAVTDKPGIFTTASGGTLFLDEVAALEPPAQVKLLRVLQDGELRRVGDNLPAHVNVRVIAATHRDLCQLVAAASFRENLYYRLAVFPIALPPLAERKEDIALLVEHFRAHYAAPPARARVCARGARRSGARRVAGKRPAARAQGPVGRAGATILRILFILSQ